MKKVTIAALSLLVGLTLMGCAGRKKNTMTVSTVPANPVVQVIPQPTREPNPRVAVPANEAEPIYRNPVIEEVELAPYIDAETGNLVFPGKVLVIREPGHWNLEAAQKKNQYFIPLENQPDRLIPPSRSYYDYIQSKKNGARTTTLDISRVRVTGYASKEERPEALKVLQPGETLAYDPYLGWLAIPSDLAGKVENETWNNRIAAPTDTPLPQAQLQKIFEGAERNVNPGVPNQGMPSQMGNPAPATPGMPNQGMPNAGAANQGMTNQGINLNSTATNNPYPGTTQVTAPSGRIGTIGGNTSYGTVTTNANKEALRMKISNDYKAKPNKP